MNDRRTYKLHLSAVPAAFLILGESGEILVIAVDKKSGKVLFLQPVEPVVVLFVSVPDAAEVAADDYVIVLGKFLLLRELIGVQFGDV